MPETHELQVLIASRVPVIVVETHEEQRVDALIERLAMVCIRHLRRNGRWRRRAS